MEGTCGVCSEASCLSVMSDDDVDTCEGLRGLWERISSIIERRINPVKAHTGIEQSLVSKGLTPHA